MVETLHTLLRGLIDYAGMFPPASLDFAAAVRNYAAYREGEHAWMLGRFIVPAAQLDQVDPTWPVSVLGMPPRRVEVCELKADRAAVAVTPDAALTYFEIPLTDDPAPLAAIGARAKIRMGGAVTPSASEVARFLRSCAVARVAFKATAGLHHPIRHASVHGFVNLWLAAALAWRAEDPMATLEEVSPAAFHFEDGGVAWHDHRVSAAAMRVLRSDFAISFGSCSFEEPIAGLRELGWL
jgi:hypothetical protein